MARRAAGVLDHIATIEQLDLDGVQPTSHVVEVENALRADVPRPSLPARASRSPSAPAVVDDGFAVPSPQA